MLQRAVSQLLFDILGTHSITVATQARAWVGRDGNVRIIREIMLVPLPRAASRRLMSFFTFHISI